jgi:uncharacterized protein
MRTFSNLLTAWRLLLTLAFSSPVYSMKPDSEMDLYDAAQYGKFARVEQLLKLDPSSINAGDKYGFTALHGVVGEHYFEMASLLITKGANVNAKNDEGVTPLHLAAYPEMAEILVASGANLEARDASGNTPLHLATEHPEMLDVVEKLVELGADVSAKNNDGQTALDIAISRDDAEKIEFLQ